MFNYNNSSNVPESSQRFVQVRQPGIQFPHQFMVPTIVRRNNGSEDSSYSERIIALEDFERALNLDPEHVVVFFRGPHQDRPINIYCTMDENEVQVNEQQVVPAPIVDFIETTLDNDYEEDQVVPEAEHVDSVQDSFDNDGDYDDPFVPRTVSPSNSSETRRRRSPRTRVRVSDKVYATTNTVRVIPTVNLTVAVKLIITVEGITAVKAKAMVIDSLIVKGNATVRGRAMVNLRTTVMLSATAKVTTTAGPTTTGRPKDTPIPIKVTTLIPIKVTTTPPRTIVTPPRTATILLRGLGIPEMDLLAFMTNDRDESPFLLLSTSFSRSLSPSNDY
ncbi:hypothetical protein BGZ96_011340 [Linnemannia gamsii]|uniref:Uncharacterized protein n=1 Tax=Linnemannia gamsii TaxID=64522 RepID=A0ABQ7JT89_9FUNG|nr:hypothetical protein BGZ96_011340 [Linnemannia gamsii]